jgi:RNA polymerase sigma-70 factor, ECF subfamily
MGCPGVRAAEQRRVHRLATRATLDAMVREALPGALRFAIRLTGDAGAAEDVVQDALVRAAARYGGFRGESAFRTWLFRIIINVWRDHQRRAAPLPNRPARLEDDLVDRRSRDPSLQCADGELARRIAQRVSALPPRLREVFVLSTYEELSAPQICEVLGVSAAAVHTALYEARARLRQELAAYRIEN